MPLFFVHIPKTAGTSFRLGAEQLFDKSRIVYDYGKASSATSHLTQQTLYGECPDFWAFGKGCERQHTAMVGGHVDVARFVSLLGVGNTLSFLREPLQRMASEYAHFVRKFDYSESFYNFYSRPGMLNRQTKAMRGVEIEAVGMLGLTERYSESLELVNARYDIAIPGREDNRGKESLKDVYDISPGDEAELKRLNKLDMALYKRAKALFDARHKLFQEGQPWAHARLVEANAQRVAGWAWWAASDEPVEVEILINNECRASQLATDLRPGLCHLLPPRGGYVGFQLPVKLNPGDRVQCRVVSTGQCFPPVAHRVKKLKGTK